MKSLKLGQTPDLTYPTWLRGDAGGVGVIICSRSLENWYYMTSFIKRFGDYLMDLDVVPQALEEGTTLVF